MYFKYYFCFHKKREKEIYLLYIIINLLSKREKERFIFIFLNFLKLTRYHDRSCIYTKITFTLTYKNLLLLL